MKLPYADPEGFLVEWSEVEPFIAASALPSRVKELRTHRLREWKQAREAALFCHGLGAQIGSSVLFAREEQQDYDFVARWDTETSASLLFVQLKEVVRPQLNEIASVQATIDGLEKYADSGDLAVAIYLNRPGRFDPNLLILPSTPLAGLWVFGALTEDRSEWALWGNLYETRQGTRFSYPRRSQG